jgi:hypothetical protein
MAPHTTLTAGTIGSDGNPIKISAGASTASNTLYVRNSTGSSYVNEIGTQAFGTVDLTIGSQANSTQNIQVMGDAGGDGATGTGHVILNTDADGLLNIAENNIKTGGGTGVSATNVAVYAPNITFADNSVDTGTASFTATASGTLSSSQVDNLGDISGSTVSLSAPNIGTAANPMELGAGTTLSINNTGGSTYVKSVSDNFSTINLTNYKTAGTHHILFSGGDHIDYITDGDSVVLPTISGGDSDGETFGSTTGIDVTRGNRNVRVTPYTGDLIFGDNSVNIGSGKFGPIYVYSGNIAALNTYNPSSPVAQITAGDVEFYLYNSAGTIGAGGKDIQIAQGAGASNNTLTIYSYGEDVNIHELSPNHFKTLNIYSYNSTGAAKTVSIDLNGPDDVNFSDDGSLVTIDADTVNLSDNNRNWYLRAYYRDLQVDGVSLGTGSYTLYTNQRLKLNTDVVTNDGSIQLTGSSGIDLLKSVSVDSNSDNLGYSGSINMNGSISSTGGSRTLTVDSSSTDTSGGYIYMYSGLGNGAGEYLTGLTLTSKGSTDTNDGVLYLFGSNYLLNGNFSATGNTYLYYSTTIDTEQGDLASGGNITFGGYRLYTFSNYVYTFNTATAAAGGNGGDVILSDTYSHGTISASGITVNTTGGAGGTAGSISLPSVSTTYSGAANIQSYTGGIITLNGNLTTDKGAVILDGDTRLAANVTIDTWQGTNSTRTGTAGAVTISGTGVSATSADKNLTINTSTDTGTDYYTETTPWDHSGGNVTISAGNAGGAYLNNLSVITSNGGTYNNGTNGTLTLNIVGTEGFQSYTGGAATVSGALTTNGGDIGLSGVDSLVLSGVAVTIDTDRIEGTNDAGVLDLGTHALNGALALTIDTTADGGGTGADLTLNNVGNTTPLSSLNVASKGLTVGTGGAIGIIAAADITLEANGALSDLTLNIPVTSTSGDIVLAAGRNFINNNSSDTGIVAGSGQYFVYASDPAGSTKGMTTGFSKHYNQTYTAGATPDYATTGNWFLYSIAPVITITSSTSAITYGEADPTLTPSYTGLIDGDTSAVLTGSPTLALASFTPSGAGNRPAGTYNISLTGSLTDDLGYQYAPFNGSLTVNTKNLTTTDAVAQNKVYDATTAATITGGSLVGVLSGDTITVSGGGAFADKTVGAAKSVTAALTIAGDDSGNYALTQPTGLTADITKADLVVTGLTASNKVYDATTTAVLGGTAAITKLGSDDVTIGGTAAGAFADKNVATGKAVTVTGNTISGDDAGNYTLVQQTGLTADITQATLTTTGAAAQNKIYDATTAATITGETLVGVLLSDTVTVSGGGTFADKTVGAAKSVTAALTIAGDDSGNYALTQPTGLTADITKADLAVTGLTASNKVYDATTTAALGGTAAITKLGTDDVTIGGTAAGAFADKNVAAGKAVTVTGNTISGDDAGNYTLVQQTGLTADITAKEISATDITADDKSYDGTTDATLNTASAGVYGVIVGDTATLDTSYAAGSFIDLNVGQNKTVNVTGLGLSGADAGNYTLAAYHTTASITGVTMPASLLSPQRSINGTQLNQSSEMGAPATSEMGPGGGSIMLASFIASTLVNDLSQTGGDKILSSTVFTAPVTFTETGSTSTMILGGSTPSGTLVEVGTLTVFTQRDGIPVVQGSFVVQESPSSLSLTRTTFSGAVQEIGKPAEQVVPFTLSTPNGERLNLMLSVTNKGFLVITVPDSGVTIDLSQVVLMGLMITKNEQNTDIGNLKGVLLINAN